MLYVFFTCLFYHHHSTHSPPPTIVYTLHSTTLPQSNVRARLSMMMREACLYGDSPAASYRQRIWRRDVCCTAENKWMAEAEWDREESRWMSVHITTMVSMAHKYEYWYVNEGELELIVRRPRLFFPLHEAKREKIYTFLHCELFCHDGMVNFWPKIYISL